ncbi:MAG: GWxTD domain-containing protein [Bryobacteraceae bacterium]|jgi:GWxTD domain-containing protein
MTVLRYSISLAALSVAAIFPVAAQTAAAQKSGDQTASEPAERETVARPLSERQKKKNEEKLKKELETPYRKWLNEDVTYIITDDERKAFARLQTDEEREQFIEQFWLRRDPTPDTVENEYKEEHYRRIAYANEHFASGIPGWKSDRGRIYITFGPPDEITDYSQGGSYYRPMEEGGGETSVFPFIQWRYRYIENVGTDINIEFVDTTMSGEFRMTMDPSEKDALTNVPGAGLTISEQMGITSKNDRFNRTDGTQLGIPQDEMNANQSQFRRLEQYVNLQKPPEVKFKDLESVVKSRISYNLLPMKVRVDYFPITDASVLTNVTVQFANKDLEFSAKQGVQRATLNIYGRITTMTRRVVNVFEDTAVVDAPQEFLADYAKQRSIYQKTVPLIPGTYRLNVVAKDLVSGTLSDWEVAITVPRIDPDKLTSSSVVLADLIEPVAMKSIGAGAFVIGSSKVRPRVDEIFKRDEKMGIYFQCYNFGEDETTHKPSGVVEWEVVKNGSNAKIFDYTQDLTQIPNASASEVIVQEILPLKTFEPGQYTIRIKVTDKVRNQVLTNSAQFTVT